MKKNNRNYSGLADVNDFKTKSWQKAFKHLEKVQADFLASNPHSVDYHWPKDALHNFIRVWEYPFVFNQIKNLFSSLRGKKVLDLGSGITFFPHAVSQLGAKVVALDYDPKTKIGLEKANQHLGKKYGKLEIVVADAKKTFLESASFDLVYCVSVLEHIPQNYLVVKEINRILKKNGLCVLTFDINLSPNEIGLNNQNYLKLRESLDEYFELLLPEKFVHPSDVVDANNSLYPLKQASSEKLFLRNIIRFLMGKKPIKNYNITSLALVLRKKS